MKKKFLFALLACSFLAACSTKDSDADFDVYSSPAGGNDWAEADITDLRDTRASSRFNNEVISPVIYFNFNSAALSAQALDVLNEQVAWLHNNPKALVVVEGHCDERGTREYNLALSEKRASAVADYFIANGIDCDRVRIIGYGKERPAVFGSFESAWAKNRRAVTIVQ